METTLAGRQLKNCRAATLAKRCMTTEIRWYKNRPSPYKKAVQAIENLAVQNR